MSDVAIRIVSRGTEQAGGGGVRGSKPLWARQGVSFFYSGRMGFRQRFVFQVNNSMA